MTSRRLLLVRHGQAEQFASDDHSRELTGRGRRNAAAAGRWIASQGLTPDAALVSTAARTRQTWAEIAQALGAAPEPAYERALYAADQYEVLDVLRLAPAEASTLVVVGHNPSVSHLAYALDDGTADPEAFRQASTGMPTAAVALLEVQVPWADIAEGTARLVAVHVD